MRETRFQTTRPLLPKSKVYIRRAGDRQACALLRQGEYVHVAESRKQGKTSLIHHLQAEFAGTTMGMLYLDLSRLEDESASAWYTSFFSHLASQWKKQLTGFPPPPSVSRTYSGWDRWLDQLEVRLADKGLRLVLALDEVRLPRFPNSDQFFIRIRSHLCDPNPDRRITFLFAGVFAPTELIQGIDISPFNVGERVRLRDFTQEELKDLMVRGGLGLATAQALGDSVYSWTGGHPFLTQCLCAELPPDCSSLRELDQAARRVRNRHVDYFRHIQQRLHSQPRLRDTVAEMLRDNELSLKAIDATTQSELELLGVIKDEDDHWTIRNRFYREALQATTHPQSTGGAKCIFVSYARKDESKMRQVLEHLKAEWLQAGFIPWADPQLKAGTPYREELTSVIRGSVAAVLLVSLDFINSDFIQQEELPLIRKRHEQEDMPVFPFILSPSPWDLDPWLSSLQAHPRGPKAFNELKGKAMKARALQTFAREISMVLTSTGS